MKLPAISLHRPWAQWVAAKLKTIETRTHSRFASLDGRLIAIHSAMHFQGGAMEQAQVYFPRSVLWEARRQFDPCCSAVICLAEAQFIGELDFTYSPDALCACNRWLTGLRLSEIQPLNRPFRMNGNRGIFYVDIPEEFLP